MSNRYGRKYTDYMLEMGENNPKAWELIAKACLNYMSEKDVEDLAFCDFGIDLENDEEEDEEDA